MQVKIRPAQEQDGKSIAKLWMEVWHSSLKTLVPINFLDQFSLSGQELKYSKRAIDKDWILLVALYNEQLVGMIGATTADQTTFPDAQEIKSMYIAPQYQRQGIGSLLFKTIFSNFKQIRVSKAVLWCIKENNAACLFYEKHGGIKIDNVSPPSQYSIVPHIAYHWYLDSLLI